MTEGMLNFLRSQFPAGCAVMMGQGSANSVIPAGTKATLAGINDAGEFMIRYGDEDLATVSLDSNMLYISPPNPHIVRYYMPMTMSGIREGADCWCDDEDDDNCGEVELTSYEAASYSWAVSEALARYNADAEKNGLMEWFDDDDCPAVAHKVIACRPYVVRRDGRLLGVAECTVVGELLDEEEKALLDYIEGQMSDGFGEGFEQKPIRVDGMELFAHFWQFDGWFIKREDQLFPGNKE